MLPQHFGGHLVCRGVRSTHTDKDWYAQYDVPFAWLLTIITSYCRWSSFFYTCIKTFACLIYMVIIKDHLQSEVWWSLCTSCWLYENLQRGCLRLLEGLMRWGSGQVVDIHRPLENTVLKPVSLQGCGSPDICIQRVSVYIKVQR